jgi:broad specificity phosphatase PhoE
LTPKGIEQASITSSTFGTTLSIGGMPPPESFYVSPLWRCLQTADSTWTPLVKLLRGQEFKPVIKELFRETIGAHTCDRRSRKTEIHPLWEAQKGYVFEDGFTEEDELWKPDLRETDNAADDRVDKALDELWTSDKNTWISVTTHSGLIAAFLRGKSSPLPHHQATASTS